MNLAGHIIDIFRYRVKSSQLTALSWSDKFTALNNLVDFQNLPPMKSFLSNHNFKSIKFRRVMRAGDNDSRFFVEIITGKVNQRRRNNTQIDDVKTGGQKTFC